MITFSIRATRTSLRSRFGLRSTLSLGDKQYDDFAWLDWAGLVPNELTQHSHHAVWYADSWLLPPTFVGTTLQLGWFSEGIMAKRCITTGSQELNRARCVSLARHALSSSVVCWAYLRRMVKQSVLCCGCCSNRDHVSIYSSTLISLVKTIQRSYLGCAGWICNKGTLTHLTYIAGSRRTSDNSCLISSWW